MNQQVPKGEWAGAWIQMITLLLRCPSMKSGLKYRLESKELNWGEFILKMSLAFIFQTKNPNDIHTNIKLLYLFIYIDNYLDHSQ